MGAGRGRRARFRGVELDMIRARRHLKADVVRIRRLAIVLRQALANLGGADADDGICGGVVIRGAAEHIHTEVAFLHAGSAGKTLVDDVRQEVLALLAVPEGGARRIRANVSRTDVSAGFCCILNGLRTLL